MEKNNSRFGIVTVLALAALVAYNVLVFVICGFGGHGASFWIAYGFTLAAFALVGVVVAILNAKNSKPKDALIDLPIFKHSITYASAALVASVVFMVADYFINIWAVVLIFEVILLGVYAVVVASGFMAKEIVEETEVKVKKNTQKIRLLCADAEMVAEREDDADVKKAFADLAEQIRYSDPVSNPALEELENKIIELVGCVKNIEDKQVKLNICKEASMLLLERNKKTKALK